MENDDLLKGLENDKYPERVKPNISDDEIDKVLKDANQQLESKDHKKKDEKKADSVKNEKEDKADKPEEKKDASKSEEKNIDVPKFAKKTETEKKDSSKEEKSVKSVEPIVDDKKDKKKFTVPLVEEPAKSEKNMKKEEDEKKTDSKTEDKSEHKTNKKSKNKSDNKNNKESKSEKESKQKKDSTKEDSEQSKQVEKEWKIEDEEPFVVKEEIPDDPVYGVPRKMTFGRVMGMTLEFIWTVFKVAFVIALVTAIAGFLLSRTMMIRGRNGNRQCLEGVTYSSTVLANKDAAEEEVEKWLEDVRYEKVTLEADDGSILVAKKFMIYKNSDKWAVILHGYNGDTTDVYDIAKKYTMEGYNVLLPDLRAHGESEGHFIGMGWLDRLDVINWIDTILDENLDAQIVVHGVEMGGATALMMTGSPLKDSIKAVVAEGAYSNAQDVVQMEYEARHEKLPVFPFFYMMNPVMKVWAGYSLSEADAVASVAKAKVPILLIHGANDTYATKEMADELNGAIASTHKLVTIQSGGHEDCRYAEPDEYYNNVFDFVNTYVK